MLGCVVTALCEEAIRESIYGCRKARCCGDAGIVFNRIEIIVVGDA